MGLKYAVYNQERVMMGRVRYTKLDVPCAPKLLFLIEKILERFWIIFDIENLLWKSNFDAFWRSLALRIWKKKLNALSSGYQYHIGHLILYILKWYSITEVLLKYTEICPYFLFANDERWDIAQKWFPICVSTIF